MTMTFQTASGERITLPVKTLAGAATLRQVIRERHGWPSLAFVTRPVEGR